MRRLVMACVAAMLLGACSGPAPEGPAAPVQPAAPAHTATVPKAPAADWALVRVKIVDIEGNPVPYAAPIASSQPNAFEKPVVVGEPANDQGDAAFYIPPDQRLYIRGWDFSLRMFANNYYDVFPGPVMEAGVMKLVMVLGSTIRAELVGPDGQPAAGAAVGLMMYHPSQGAWWPTEATCDAKGVALFGPVPAGIFTLKLKTEAGAFAETGSVTLQPGGLEDLGRINLTLAGA